MKFLFAVLISLGFASALFAQQSVSFEMGIPKAPEGLANQPLGAGPFVFRTGEDMDIRVVVLTQEIAYPYALTFLPDGDMLVTTRGGALRRMRGDTLEYPCKKEVRHDSKNSFPRFRD